jgi:hypothetical protein
VLPHEHGDGKIQGWHRDRLATVYLLPELQRISAAQQAGRSSRRIMLLSGMPESAGGVSCDGSVGAAESGHTALNRSPTSFLAAAFPAPATTYR